MICCAIVLSRWIDLQEVGQQQRVRRRDAGRSAGGVRFAFAVLPVDVVAGVVGREGFDADRFRERLDAVLRRSRRTRRRRRCRTRRRSAGSRCARRRVREPRARPPSGRHAAIVRAADRPARPAPTTITSAFFGAEELAAGPAAGSASARAAAGSAAAAAPAAVAPISVRRVKRLSASPPVAPICGSSTRDRLGSTGPEP